MRNQRFMTLPQFSALSNELKDLIAGLLRTDQTQRLTIKQALMHPWMVARTLQTLTQ